MKNVLVIGIAALALVGCAKKEEAPAPADTSAPADAAPGALVVGTNENGAPVVNGGPAVEVTGGPTGSEPAKEPNVVVPAK